MLSWESLHSITVGGGAVAVSQMAAALARAGHDVHVFTRMAPGQRYHDVVDGVHYHRCPYPPHDEFVDEMNNMCRAFVERFFVVEDMTGEFDLVHANDWLTANAMIWIKQGRGRKCVMQIHSTEYARCGNAFPGGRSARVRELEHAGTSWADRVICVSNATREEVVWMYQVPEEKSTVLYNGVNADEFHGEIDAGSVKQTFGIGPSDPTVLYSGRLEWQKGPDLLVEAIPRVLEQTPRARFVFAGDGAMRADLERRVGELGIGHAVRFLGFRKGAALVALFKMSDIVCVPSRNEPFGIVVLEAWSAGKPVVVTENGGPNEFVEHGVNGLKIKPEPDSIAWGLQNLLGDMERARRMGRDGSQAADTRFSWSVVASRALEIYGTALAGGNGEPGVDGTGPSSDATAGRAGGTPNDPGPSHPVEPSGGARERKTRRRPKTGRQSSRETKRPMPSPLATSHPPRENTGRKPTSRGGSGGRSRRATE